MKKMLALIIAILLLFSFAACSVAPKEAPSEDINPSDEPSSLDGGITQNTEFESVTIPEDAKAVFDKALEAGYEGLDLEPIALLGTQVVAGLNYAFLCKGTTVTADPVTSLKIVTIYNDLDDNASIQDVKDLEETNFASDSEQGLDSFEPELVGGWEISSESSAALPKDAQAALDKALDGFVGVAYSPVALLGTQVVAGTNYFILCTATPATQEPKTSLAVLKIYADLDDNAEILSINGFDFTE